MQIAIVEEGWVVAEGFAFNVTQQSSPLSFAWSPINCEHSQKNSLVKQASCACRLFSSAVYNDKFSAHTPPEILNTPLEGVVLLMKAMQIEQVYPSNSLYLLHCYYICAAVIRLLQS